VQLFLNILLLIAGLAALVVGAEFFVRSASSLAKKLKVSTLMIGLTIVAFGTGLPEIVMALIGGITGHTDLALGNIIGSNMVNMLLIMGLAAVIVPLSVQKETRRIDLPALMIMSFMLLIFCLDPWLNGADENMLTRGESIILLLAVAVYETIIIVGAKRNRLTPFEIKQEVEAETKNQTEDKTVTEAESKTEDSVQTKTETKKEMKIWKVLLLLFGGIVLVGAGGQAVSMACETIAVLAGLSETLIGATIVGVSTNFPELFTMLFAIKRKENDLAIGTLIGSNILNMGFILSIMGVTSQILITTNVVIDMIIMLAATIFVSVAAYTRGKISRFEGIVLLAMYVGYITYIIIRN
jgi:cation:H+ antiporter